MVVAGRCGAVALALTLVAFLAGCASETAPPPVAAAASSVSPDALVGKWGLASYRRDEDRARTVKEARAQCNKPYVINRGPGGGVMMYLADQPELQELVLKAGPDGVTYLGPPGDAGTAADRMISKIDPDSFTTVWVDPDNAARYGTMVFERCGKRA